MNTNKLNFNYLPLTFISSENEIKNHIVNTIIFRYIQDTYKDVRKLGELLVKSQYGFTASAQESGNVRLLRISDIKNNKVNWDTVPYCDCANVNYLLKKEDILVARTGGTTGKSFYIDEISEDTVFASYLIRLTASNDINPKFIMLFFNTYLYWNQILTMKSGSAQPNVNAEKLKTLIISYCSLELQEKFIEISENINTNTEEFKPLVNKIENALSQYSLIKKQNNIIDENFKLIEKLRQSILQEALEGKLVKQDPNDEPAVELLIKIQTEKEKLINEGKIKKEKPLAPISKDEIPYDLPKGWVWVRLGDIANYGSTGNIEFKEIKDLNTWILDLEDIEKETSKLIQKVRVKEKPFQSNKKVFKKNDVLYGKLRPYLDKVIIADEDGVCTTEIVPIRIYGHIESSFLRYSLKRPDFIFYVNSLTYGTKMPRLGTGDAVKSLHPIPPLNEQKRIVKKINELMKFCDELEEKVKQSKDTIEKLLESLLHELFSK